MQKPEITIHDIAKKLNISASTVSRALKDNPLISEATRKKIKKAAEEMGYRPNVMAANLRTKRTNTIGVIVPLINRHFFSSVISGIEDVAYKQGFAVTISQSNDNLEKESTIAHTFYSNRVDGLILSIGMETQSYDHLKLFSERNIPLVFFDRVVDEIPSHKIVVDDFGGAYRATQHLITQGRKRIAHIGGPLNLKIYTRREEGYRQALKDADLPIDDQLILHNSLTREDGLRAIKKIVNLKERPDAIFCANDTTALSTIIYLNEKRINVPEEIAIVGFSNEPFSELVTPSITTVKQPGFEMGQKAAELLIKQINSKTKPTTFETITMKTELVIRNSSKTK
ncbi:LacI family DNA-binding transcriptional regulator [Draconibacterium sp. IB214405]|uniref:LacI family DNA-binding transcriptional regulator n=1 Tax=Draconibacterium sp. IB214405 TaxID=3097352 RepID=UPI002A0C522B|nr:LacI family DNA-binding transcriptional regulator [Draconibacterium sp. IB214405]MDX8341276.1 LacI family DNA-binding transcriptional regulator [Draconibacterium sp. IB214405]